MSTTTSVYALVKHARGDTPWDVEVNADLDTIDAEIARPRLPPNSPTVGATTTCDLNLSRFFIFTVSQATTLAFTNVPSASFAVRIRLLITNGSAFVLTFPASVTWLAGSAPTLRASGVDEVALITKDAGTTWYASVRAPNALVVSPGAAQVGLAVTQAAATTVDALAISGGTQTGATSKSLVNLAQTWNTTGKPSAVLANITDTASHVKSLLVRLDKAGIPQFCISKWGQFGSLIENIATTGGGTFTPIGRMHTRFTQIDASAFTIGLALNPLDPDSSNFPAQELTYEIFNNSGGAMGAITWNAGYKFAAGAAPTNPATGKRRYVVFVNYDNGANYYEKYRSTGDV